MAGSIRLYGGERDKMPALPERAPGYCTDTSELYIGAEGGNLLIASAAAASGRFEALELEMAESIAEIAEASTLADVIAAYNTLLTALKGVGVIKEA